MILEELPDVIDFEPIDPATLLPMEDDEGRGMSAGLLVSEAEEGPRTLIGNYPTVSARGLDVSNYDAQAGVNWAQLYAAGFRFVWVKIGEGVTYFNPSAASMIAGARAHGFEVGGYWFCQPGNGAQQAHLMLSLPQTPKGPGDLVPIMDLEVSGLNPTFANTFTNQVKATLNCWAGSYSSRSYFQNTLANGAGWEKPGSLRWIAAYGGSGPGIACDVWQNSSSTQPAGTHRATDTDIAYTPLAKMTIGQTSPNNVTTEDDSMGTCVLSDGTLATVYIDRATSAPKLSLDGGNTSVQLSASKYLAGVNVITMDGVGLTAAVRDAKTGMHMLHIPDVHNAAATFKDQPIGGTGAGTPSIAMLPDKTLVFTVKGTLATAADAGRVYVKRIHSDGTVNEWAPTAARAL